MMFVLMLAAVSFFADFTYEGARGVLGPYLASLQTPAFVVGAVIGLGELLGYGLRYFSGLLADRTGRFWPITIFGYMLQMAVVPALALTDSWKSAAVLIVLERAGKGIRNPPRDAMLSCAAGHLGGYGWTFGIDEACDQFGAMFGPLIVAFVLARHGSYHEAFAVLLVPAIINVLLVLTARLFYPKPEDMEAGMHRPVTGAHLSGTFWIYLAGAALVAAGFADYPLLAYHFAKADVMPIEWIAVFYAIAMAVSGMASLALGRLFDRYGFRVLAILTAVASLFAPLAFLGGFSLALVGAALWGIGMGVHESIIPAALAPMVPADRRASAFGLFAAGYGLFWFLGSAAIGFIYGLSIPWTVAFCMLTQWAAVPIFLWVGRRRHHELLCAAS
jgi:MFS family permease